MFVASFNLPLPFVFDILFAWDKPERGRCNYKKEGNDGRCAGGMTEGLDAETRNLTRHCHPTGITPGMIDIFRDDSFFRATVVVSLAFALPRAAAWYYTRSDAPYQFNTLALIAPRRSDEIVNRVSQCCNNVMTFSRLYAVITSPQTGLLISAPPRCPRYEVRPGGANALLLLYRGSSFISMTSNNRFSKQLLTVKNRIRQVHIFPYFQ